MRPRALATSHSKRFSSPDATFTDVSPVTRSRVLREAANLFTAHAKCKDLWSALQVADYKKEGVLNEAAVIVLFEKEKEKFQELLLVNSSEELVSLLDEFEDGFLTEDEQILIFSLIKERMQLSADALCAIHEYTKYKEMMKAVRALEADIGVYQDILRKRTHDREMQAYRELGEDKLQRFQDDWKRKFDGFRVDSEKKMMQMKRRHAREMKELKDPVKRERYAATARPSARIRTLQVEERLVAINERFNEAQKIHHELRTLELDDQERISRLVQSDLAKNQRSLALQHAKELRQFTQKMQTMYYRLKIEMEQQEGRLQKEIKLHLNDITKNQNLAKKLARKLGETRDELRRTKQKAKEMMRVMSEAKLVPSSRTRTGSEGRELAASGSLPGIMRKPSIMASTRSTAATPYALQQSPLREFVKNVTHFNIASEEPTSEGPVNQASSSTMSGKLAEELSTKRNAKSALKSVGRLYNEFLQPVEQDDTDL